MAGITGKSCVALFPLWSLKKKCLYLPYLLIILTSLPLPLLHFSIIRNSQTKTKYFHFRNFCVGDKKLLT